MLILVLVRIAITLTFLILAAGGPYAILLLRRFIRRDTVAHAALALRVATLERHVGLPTPKEEKEP